MNPIHSKYFGNRKDFHELKENIREAIKSQEIFHLCKTQVSDSGDVSITICNLWRMERQRGIYRFLRFSIKEKSWKEIDHSSMSDFPYIPFYPVNNDTSFWRGIIHKALTYVANELGFASLPYSQEISDGVPDASCMTKDMFTKILIRIYLGEKVDIKKPKAKKSKFIYKGGFLNKRAQQFSYGAIALRRDFFRYFYDKELFSGMLSINFGCLNFYDYLLFLTKSDAVKRIIRERKNMLPILMRIDPNIWGRPDLFSKSIWVRGERSRTMVDTKPFRRYKLSSSRLTSFTSKQAWNWLCHAKIGTIQSWVKNGCSPRLAAAFAKADLNKIRCSHITMKHLLNYFGDKNHYSCDDALDRFGTDENVTHIIRCFILHTENIWSSQGHNGLKQWLNASRESIIEYVFDWLRDEGFANGHPNKKSSWKSLLRHTADWHDRQVLEAKRKALERSEYYKQFKWDCLLQDTTINGVHFSPLTDGYSLLKEGYEMHHCVGGHDYVQACINKNYLVFSVIDHNVKRSTLGLYKSLKDGITQWQVHQHVTYCNDAPSTKALSAGILFCQKYSEVYAKTV